MGTIVVLIHHQEYERIPPILHTLFLVCFDKRNDDSPWVRQQGTITLRRVAIFFDICTIWEGNTTAFSLFIFLNMSGEKYDHWNTEHVYS